MPMKVVPPVLTADRRAVSKHDIGPISVMSGCMTKKTRSFNRWKQRWWQLMDNGFLFYFKDDNHLKILGEIDIARTCYDVRLGSEKCHTLFPRAAPSCCCISFAVLKRTYYVYTPTAGEADKWYQALSSMSRIINRKIVAGVERRRAPEPPCPSRPPSCPPNYQVRITRVRTHKGRFDSCEDITKIEYVRKDRSSSNLSSLSGRAMAMSMPDYLHKIDDDSVSLAEDVSLDSRLWLDGSPPAQGQVHPQSSSSMNEASWTTPTNMDRQISYSPKHPPMENHENTEDQCPTNPSNRSDSIEILSYSPSAAPEPLARSKILSKSVTCLGIDSDPLARPVPKPRKGKALMNRAVTETQMTAPTDSTSLQNLTPIRPRKYSEPPVSPRKPPRVSEGQLPTSMRLRNNSAPSSESRSKKQLQKKRNKRSRIFSPPSTPPPPPCPLADETRPMLFPLLPPPLSPQPRPRMDSGPPTFVPMLPKPARYRDSGPPNFIPPPPVEEDNSL